MRRGLKITGRALGTVFVLLVALLFAGPSVLVWVLSPDHRFGDKPLPDAPDYSLRAHWAAWPDDASRAEDRPVGIVTAPQSERLADAFFLHPTSYGGTEHWVQPMDDENARRDTDRGSIARQASVFNGCCRVYAPRFRQANMMGYQQENAGEIMDVGYQDIREAFLHFLAEIDADGPIVLGSHSQGTFQMARLVMEEIDGTPLADRLVAAYAIGHSLSSALVEEGLQDIDLCRSPTQTGCFISWDAHEGNRAPTPWSDQDDQMNWNGRDYSGYGQGGNICVNPISWTTDSRPSAQEHHLGGLPDWSKSSDGDGELPQLVTQTVSVVCEQGERSNWLFVNADRDPRLKSGGIWALFGRNLHGSDYGLFWGNIRQNAIDRTHAFLESRDG